MGTLATGFAFPHINFLQHAEAVLTDKFKLQAQLLARSSSVTLLETSLKQYSNRKCGVKGL